MKHRKLYLLLLACFAYTAPILSLDELTAKALIEMDQEFLDDPSLALEVDSAISEMPELPSNGSPKGLKPTDGKTSPGPTPALPAGKTETVAKPSFSPVLGSADSILSTPLEETVVPPAHPVVVQAPYQPVYEAPPQNKKIPLVYSPDYLSNFAGRSLSSLPATAGTYGGRLSVPYTTPMAPLASVPDIAVILSNNQFYPSRIRLREGIQTRLIFTTVNRKPAALVIEKLQVQRWVANEGHVPGKTEEERSRFEANRELNSTRVTEVNFDPKKGIYSFHDALSGASGEITVE